MLRNLVLTIGFLSTFCTTLQAASVLAVDYGLSKVDYAPLSDLNVTPTGGAFGISLGSRTGMIEPEVFFRSLAASGDIIHDGVSNKVDHDQKTFGAAIKFYLTKKFYLRFGYTFSNTTHKIAESQGEHADSEIWRIYGLVDGKLYNGPTYGLGYNFFDGKIFDVYTHFARTHTLESGSEMSVSLGIKFYFNLGFRSAFR